jgi:hypothetical protein
MDSDKSQSQSSSSRRRGAAIARWRMALRLDSEGVGLAGPCHGAYGSRRGRPRRVEQVRSEADACRSLSAPVADDKSPLLTFRVFLH